MFWGWSTNSSSNENSFSVNNESGLNSLDVFWEARTRQSYKRTVFDTNIVPTRTQLYLVVSSSQKSIFWFGYSTDTIRTHKQVARRGGGGITPDYVVKIRIIFKINPKFHTSLTFAHFSSLLYFSRSWFGTSPSLKPQIALHPAIRWLSSAYQTSSPLSLSHLLSLLGFVELSFVWSGSMTWPDPNNIALFLMRDLLRLTPWSGCLGR